MPTTKKRRKSVGGGSRFRIAGVMTGTSCDGIDVACLEFDASGNWQPGWTRSRPFPASLRERVLSAQVPGTRFSAKEWLELDRDLGEWLGQELKSISASVPTRRRPDVLAIHGQTIAHHPPAKVPGLSPSHGTTWQAGNLASVAAATGLTVAGQFRLGDMAAGGQGAPLMPRYHLELATRLASRSGDRRQTLSFLNVGGMANFSVVDLAFHSSRPATGKVRLGYDTGPGNCWIDLAVAAATDGKHWFDRDGKLAASTAPSMEIVDKIHSTHPHFQAGPPKSTGRDQFPWRVFEEAAARLKGAALVSTATELTAESVFRSYLRDILPGSPDRQEILVCGGGARNRELLKRLREKFSTYEVAVRSMEEIGWDPSAIEAQGFALFALRALQGMEQGGPWTGTRGWAPPGFLVPGRNWSRIASQLSNLAGINRARKVRSSRD